MKMLSRLAVVFAALVIVACGNSSNPPERTAAPPAGASAPEPKAAVPTITRQDVLSARRLYKVQVLSFDATQGYGVELPLSDLVRLRIANGSKVTLPCLTIMTKRYQNNRMVGSSRAPSIPTKDLGPGQTVEYDYYPRGHLDVAKVDKITVEIEGIIDPEVEQFFCELKGL